MILIIFLPSLHFALKNNIKIENGIQYFNDFDDSIEFFDRVSTEKLPLEAKESSESESQVQEDNPEKIQQNKSNEINEDQKFLKKSGVDYTSHEQQDFNQRISDPNNPDRTNCRLEDAIPGLPLRDYPTYDFVPETSFQCSDQSLPGYYGDVEANCQVFYSNTISLF